MKAIKTTLLLIAIFLFQQNAWAQNIATNAIAWRSTSTFVAISGETMDEVTTLVTRNDQIVWKGSNGSVKYALAILETNGAWLDIKSNGSFTYEVDHNGNRGTVRIQKSGGETVARLMLVINDNAIVYELKIINFELLP